MADRIGTGRGSGIGRTRRSLAQTFAAIVGAVFLLVGILGFIPGITTNYDMMEIAGHHSEAKLLGLFQVSVLHNIVHLLFGIVGLATAAVGAAAARMYLLIGGIIYLLLWLYGLAIDHESAANFVPLNNADNWLHLILGLGMIALWYLARPARDVRA
ncbi:protein of unknown function [Marinactinospora thermotolerans DSM 45154]|uniref:DUF4383 domain-containing protein n=2 Tax=Marinactinospora thermotolerans TaxID=531310 RepID=A0A1T4PA31_9ACTN|nr:DUF4383 domain-containing protein [Marinactinospora thermotolerans]SJZ88384.1 protein of unknown function [Marinactinospora thermotolerans DSM 45154]